MTYILGDLHVRKEEPFFSAAKSVLEEMKTKLKRGDTLIQLGDVFHTSKPYPKEYELINEFIKWCEEKVVSLVIMAGNHDYNYNQGTYSIDPLVSKQVFKFYEPTLFETEEANFFILPWEPKANFKQLIEKEYPETYKTSIEQADYLLYHFPDETIMFGTDYQGINLSAYEEINPNIIRIGGDIHVQSENYLGTPYQTRYDEKGQIGRYAKITNSDTQYIEFVTYVEYLDIEYGKEIIPGLNVLEDGASLILTIKNAPSVEAAKDKYGKYFIRLIETQTSMERVEAEEKELSSLKEAMSEFLTINKVGKQTKEYLQGVMNL